MTWKQFCEELKALGIKDNDVIAWINVITHPKRSLVIDHMEDREDGTRVIGIESE